MWRALLVAVCAALAAVDGAGGHGPTAGEPVVRGLDHVPVAVAKLEQAAERYRALGFTLKPGRTHEDGLRTVTHGLWLEFRQAP
jgi:hypothetical protein